MENGVDGFAVEQFIYANTFIFNIKLLYFTWLSTHRLYNKLKTFQLFKTNKKIPVIKETTDQLH